MKTVSFTIEEQDHKEAKKKAKNRDINLSQLIRLLLRECPPVKKAA